MVDKKNQHLNKKRVLLSFVINVVFLFSLLSTLFISPVLAFESCCKCTFDGNGNNGTICLKAPTGRGCTWAETTAQDLGNGTYQINCTFLDPQACQKIGNSDFAQCPYEPIFATDFRAQYIEQYLGFGRKQATTEEEPKGDAAGTEAIVPELGVPIPGISFPDRLKVENQYLIVPYLAIYVAGFQKIIIGIALIAAAVMIVYGGFTYIYSVNGSKIEDAKNRIKDAIVGLIIILTSVVLMANINPDTVKLKPLKIEQVKPPFPTETGYRDIQSTLEPWEPGPEQPNATPPPPSPLKLGNDKNVLNFYREEGPVDQDVANEDLPEVYDHEVKGQSFGARMLSVCQKNQSILKNVSREEQLRYAVGVLNVWIREGLLNGGAVYVRTGSTMRKGTDESTCWAGTVDPGFYFGTQATQQGWCPPLRNSLTIGLGSLNCTEAYSIAKGKGVFNAGVSYEQIAGNLESVASQMSSNPRAFVDYMNGLGDLQKYYSSALGFAGVPYPWTNTTNGTLYSAVQKIKNLPREVVVAMDGKSTCRTEATKNYQTCFAKPVGDQGFFCGDCGSTLLQFMSCVGINPGNEIFGGGSSKTIKQQVNFYNASTGETTNGSIEFGSPNLQAPSGGDSASFLFVAKDQADWFKKYSEPSIGGPQFGDIHISDCHNYMYVGGQGLKTPTGIEINWFEMGGGGAEDGTSNNINGGLSKNITVPSAIRDGIVDSFDPGSSIQVGGFQIRYWPDITAFSRTSCGWQRSMWPIYIYRPFKDDLPRCNPEIKDACPVGTACMPNYRCMTVTKGDICYDARNSSKAKEGTCGVGYECRTCTRKERFEYGWLKKHSISGNLVEDEASIGKKSSQNLPCVFTSGKVKYCMETKSAEQKADENGAYQSSWEQ